MDILCVSRDRNLFESGFLAALARNVNLNAVNQPNEAFFLLNHRSYSVIIAEKGARIRDILREIISTGGEIPR